MPSPNERGDKEEQRPARASRQSPCLLQGRSAGTRGRPLPGPAPPGRPAPGRGRALHGGWLGAPAALSPAAPALRWGVPAAPVEMGAARGSGAGQDEASPLAATLPPAPLAVSLAPEVARGPQGRSRCSERPASCLASHSTRVWSRTATPACRQPDCSPYSAATSHGVDPLPACTLPGRSAAGLATCSAAAGSASALVSQGLSRCGVMAVSPSPHRRDPAGFLLSLTRAIEHLLSHPVTESVDEHRHVSPGARPAGRPVGEGGGGGGAVWPVGRGPVEAAERVSRVTEGH